MAEQISTWLKPENYKKTYLKQHDIWACIPKQGVWFYNRLTNPVLYRKMKGTTYISEGENKQYSEARKAVTTGHEWELSNPLSVICCGVRGELFSVTVWDFAKYFAFVEGDKLVPINDVSYRPRLSPDGMEWQRVRAIESPYFWTCFVPESETGVLPPYDSLINAPTVSHGKGDFIAVRDNNGQPDLASLQSLGKVINGEVFPNICSIRGWKDCVTDKRHKAEKPDFSLCAKAGSIQQFINACSQMVHMPFSVENNLRAEGSWVLKELEGYLEDNWKVTGKPLSYVFGIYAEARKAVLKEVRQLFLRKRLCKASEFSYMRYEPWKADLEATPPVLLNKIKRDDWNISMHDIYTVRVQDKYIVLDFTDMLLAGIRSSTAEYFTLKARTQAGKIYKESAVTRKLKVQLNNIRKLTTATQDRRDTELEKYIRADALILFQLLTKLISE